MKKNKTIFIIAVLLLAVSAYFIISRRSGTIREELKDFAVEDTASVTKIFLADKFGHACTLTKKSSGNWMVNGKYRANPEAINILLLTMKNIDVRSPAGKAAYNTIMKEIAAKGTKVEIYEHDKLAKTYYVGGATMDMLGTYMYLENSSVPFIMYIPGFEGYLTTRYIVMEEEWKLKSVFDVSIEDISSVIAEDLKNPANSIMITKKPDGDFVLQEYFEKKPVAGAEQSKIQNYMSGFTAVSYEAAIRANNKEIDSVKAFGAFRRLTVTDKNKNTTVVTMYRKPTSAQSEQMNEFRSEEAANYDYDRMYAQINNDPGFVIIQYNIFDRFFKTPADFLMTPPKQTKK
jgi:hypothetical protein